MTPLPAPSPSFIRGGSQLPGVSLIFQPDVWLFCMVSAEWDMDAPPAKTRAQRIPGARLGLELTALSRHGGWGGG